MVREEARTTLPEEIVEMILARMPFPYIFKAKVLSKLWQARLSPISSQDDDEKKRLAISFQKQVGDVSTKWTIFSPVFVEKIQKEFVAYDWASDLWRKTTSLFSMGSIYAAQHRMTYLRVNGALLLIYVPPIDLYVANVLTRSWKHLPSCPGMNDHLAGPPISLMSHTPSGTYKVIKFQEDPFGLCLALIYDSKLGAWTQKTVNLSFYARVFHNPVSLNGVNYWRVGARGLLAFSFEEEDFKLCRLPHIGMPIYRSKPECMELVVCNGSLLMVVCTNQQFSVVEIDLESWRCLEISRGPPPALQNFSILTGIANGGDCIFFVGRTDQNYKALAYTVSTNEWSLLCIPAPPHDESFHIKRRVSRYLSFEPGLNPFVPV